MPMVDGVNMPQQKYDIYQNAISRGTPEYLDLARRLIESERRKQGVRVVVPSSAGSVSAAIPRESTTQTTATRQSDILKSGYSKQEQAIARVNPKLAETMHKLRTSAKEPTMAEQYKKLRESGTVVVGSHQHYPGGPVEVATEKEGAELTARMRIKETPYKEKFGYAPTDTGATGSYSAETQSINNELQQQRAYLEQVKSSEKGTTFNINNKQYSQQEAINYINKSINQLTESGAYLQRYKEAGYVLKKTDEGYSFALPKASEVVKSVYGGERPDIYIASELRTLGFGTLFAGVQQLVTKQPSLEAHKEETAEAILGTTRKPGESIEAYTGRFWTSPEAVMDVWLPVATLGVSKGITTAGRIFAPEIASIGSKLAGFGSKGSAIIQKIPDPIRYSGFRVGFASKTALYETGKVLAKPGMGYALKYGLYGTMAAPQLYETAMEQPELFGARLGQSLTRYEVGMGTLAAGGRILQKGIKEMREPMYVQQRPFTERFGLRSLGEEATQPLPGVRKAMTKGMTEEERFAFEYKEPAARISPEEAEANALARSLEKKKLSRFQEFVKSEEGTQHLPGAKRFTTKGMTEEESLAFTYKAPKQTLTAEEREAESLARSLEKKKPSRFQDFIKSEEGIQSLPGIRPFGAERRGLSDLVKGEGTGEGLPGIKPKEPATLPRKEISFTEGTGRTTTLEIHEQYPGAKVLIEKSPRVTATTIEELPRITGKLEIAEVKKTGVRLDIPVSYEREVTQLGTGVRRLDIIETKLGKPTGKLIAEESKIGELTIAEFKPGEEQYFEGLMGVKRVTPVSKYGLGSQEPSLMESGIIPETKEAAQKSFEAINKPYDISVRPEGGWAETFYGQDYARGSAVAGKPPRPISKVGAEPVSEKGIFALDMKAEEDIFYKELAEGKPSGFEIDIGRIGEAEKTKVAVKIKGQTKTFTGEELLRLGKGEIKERPQRFTKEQLQKAVYSPGGSAEYYGKQLRRTLRVKSGEPIPVGTRPEEGWGKFLGERQDAKIFIEKPKKYALPELESEALSKRTIIPRSGKTPLYFERQPGVSTESIATKEVSPIPTGKLETVSTIDERTSFRQSGIYESPDIKYVTIQRPLTREEVKILMGTEREIGAVSSHWETILPKMKERTRFISRIKEKGLASRSGGLIESLGIDRERLQFASALGGTAAGSVLLINQNLGVDRINEFDLERERLPDFLRLPISKQRYDTILGLRQGEETQQEQRQGMLSLTALEQEQLQDTLQETKPQTVTITKLFTDTRITPPPVPPYSPGETKHPPPFIPRKKKKDDYEEEFLQEQKPEKQGYDVYVKERGMYHGKVRKGFKFAKVNRKPLTESEAMALGGEITDTTRAVSFRLKKTKGTPYRSDRYVKPFSERQHKFVRKGETIIEKPEYRMDTKGELEGISALGQEERRRQGRRSRLLSFGIQPVKRTRNKSTGLYSPTTKIMETGLYKKKKGGRKNDYY
jgi:hypothetical protein